MAKAALAKAKVALVYDRVNKWGGAERTLLALREIWPEAPLFTSVYEPSQAAWAKEFKVIPSFLNRFSWARKRHEFFPWLMPLVFESFDFRDFEIVISVTSEAAKGIITPSQTLHLCYCLTPTRYLWSGYEEYFFNKKFRFLSQPLVNYLQSWDQVAAQRPDVYLAISQNVQKRIKKYYQRDSAIIYPPIDLERFKVSNFQTQNNKQIKQDDYFLVVSRLVGYKKVALVIKAFNQLGLPLKIIGSGKEEKKLKQLAKKNVEFLGQLTEQKLLGYYQRCLAVIFPQEEDFGLVALEAQACGKPVIAFQGGGALETIRERKTGVFFSPQSFEALIRVITEFKPAKYQGEDCRKNAERFSKEVFKKKFKKIVEEKWKKH